MKLMRIAVICLLLNFLCFSSALAEGILQEIVPLERSGIPTLPMPGDMTRIPAPTEGGAICW